MQSSDFSVKKRLFVPVKMKLDRAFQYVGIEVLDPVFRPANKGGGRQPGNQLPKLKKNV